VTARRAGGTRATKRPKGYGPRPDRIFGTVSATVVLLLVWEAVAHASGSGWVQGLAALAAGMAVAGLVGPGLVVRKIELQIVSAPTDARASSSFTIKVTANRPCKCIPRSPRGRAVLLDRGVEKDLVLEPNYRGVLQSVTVKVATAAPFGLVWWSAGRQLPLARPIFVAPLPAPNDGGGAQVADRTDANEVTAKLADTGELRSVREYRTGDSRRQVHWRASAHTGVLMVREHEQRALPAVRIVADLPEDPDLSEAQASEALGRVLSLLAHGRCVLLDTTEGTEAISEEVSDELAAGRRLARAGKNFWATTVRATASDGSSQ
jgi:uncharacterized protein (DUF58 family)